MGVAAGAGSGMDGLGCLSADVRPAFRPDSAHVTRDTRMRTRVSPALYCGQ